MNGWAIFLTLAGAAVALTAIEMHRRNRWTAARMWTVVAVYAAVQVALIVVTLWGAVALYRVAFDGAVVAFFGLLAGVLVAEWWFDRADAREASRLADGRYRQTVNGWEWESAPTRVERDARP